MSLPSVRSAAPGDAEAIASIFNAGIEERSASFETRLKSPEQLGRLIASGALVLVAEQDARLAGFAKVVRYEERSQYYAGVGEVTVYVDSAARRAGVGRALLDGIAAAGAQRGLHKLVAKIFSSNEPSLALFGSCGFRRVGTHRRHATLDGEWKDVVVVERLLAD
jgi:L-amino acid N-acyltransferase YncA